MDFEVGAFLLPAALVFGAPAARGHYEKGLFCELVELVERVAALGRARRRIRSASSPTSTRGSATPPASTPEAGRARPHRAVREEHRAPTTATYAIYQVQVTAHGVQKTEIGDIEWTFSPPLTMYTLRAAAPAQTVSH